MRPAISRQFRDLSLASKGIVVLGAPLITLLLAFFLVFWVERRGQQASRWVEHTLRAEQHIGAVWLDSTDAEDWVRAYTVSRRPASLASYLHAKTILASDLDRLAAIIRDNPAQVENVHRLRSALARRFEILDGVLATFQAKQPLDPAWPERSRTIATEVRIVVHAMLDEESGLLAVRTARRWHVYRGDSVMVAAFVLGLLGCGIAYRLLLVGIVARVQRVREHAVRLAETGPFDDADAAADEVGQLDRALLLTAGGLAERDATLRRFAGELESANRHLVEKTEEAERANRQKSEFLANMSHELRTPLNAILGFGEILYDGKQGAVSERQRDFLGEIVTSGRHLLGLINSVLDLAKVESGTMEFFPVRIDLEATFREVTGVLRSVSAQKRIRVETAIDPAVRSVVADASKLKQILYNYLSNAIKFTPPEGRVQLRALPANDGGFRVEVEDTGPGIAADQAGQLFTAFSQVGRTQREGGTGLGLVLTKRIVEAQGGTVGIRPAGTTGSLFFAHLPRSAEIAPTRHPEAPNALMETPTARRAVP